MIRYDDHARFQLQRRKVSEAWVGQVLAAPDAEEVKSNRRSFLKCLPGRRVMLRVATPLTDQAYVITAYFDGTRRCA